MAGQKGCCVAMHLREDNARFLLLFVIVVGYLVIGAFIFMVLEHDNEIRERDRHYRLLTAFVDKNPLVNVTELEVLLTSHADMAASGMLADKRPRWDFSGSFYFVGTVVTTIGFGMTTPRTTAGKSVLILYGFFGCAGTILFFNLFLERSITLIAFVLKSIHEQKLRRRQRKGPASQEAPPGRTARRCSETDDGDLSDWKPSVYWVTIILFFGATVIACCASAIYRVQENWTYLESLYFCFVAFATVGFGDYVVSQRASYAYESLYRFINFVIILLGCCCFYSLFNVTSIIIKQVLNVIIRKLNSRCCQHHQTSTLWRTQLRSSIQSRRRNAITPGGGGAVDGASAGGRSSSRRTHADAELNSDGCSRRGSSEISMKDFLRVSKISMAMMQKQLYETAHRGAMRAQDSGAFQGGVGPLAILNRKLYPEEI